MQNSKASAFEIEADDAAWFAPLFITGGWKGTKLSRKDLPYMDGVPKPGAEGLATQSAMRKAGS